MPLFNVNLPAEDITPQPEAPAKKPRTKRKTPMPSTPEDEQTVNRDASVE